MSNETPDDSTHPLNMDDDARQATMALLDEEGSPGEGEQGDGANAGADDEGKTADGETDGKQGEATGEGEGDDGKKPGEGAAADDEAGKGGDEDDGKDEKKAFAGVLAELRATREELKAYKQQQHVVPALPEPKDFKAEKDALKEKWEAGDLDTDDYTEQREALTLEEAEHRAAVRFHQMQQQAQQESVNAAWQTKVSAWQQQHADFLANPIRRKAVDDLLVTLDSDPDNKLSDDELLAKVQETAFEAFNWNPAPAGGAPAADPPAVNPRQQAAARAAAAASATPPAITGGVGNAAAVAKADLEAIVSNPSKHAKQARQAIDSVLGEEA